MEEAEFSLVKNKIVGGVFALTTRTFILQIISFGSTLILTVLLTPSVFGVFFVVSALISFLNYFSDIGLAAALIQKKAEPSNQELGTVFTIQQILVGSAVIIGLYFSTSVGRFYNLGHDGELLLQLLLVSFFLSSLKTIPSILLERKLEFNQLVIPQILETAVFYGLAIVLAFKGYGIASFAWAGLARGIVGVVSIYILSPWRITLCLSIPAARELLSFGIPFQANSMLALVKDDLMTVFLGKILQFSEVGYIGWAKKWAEAPLRLIMDSIIRVTFPAYSRLQENKEVLRKAIEKSIFFLALSIFFTTALLVLAIHHLVNLIPKYSKWEPAVFSFYLFSFSSVIASFSSPLVNALNALGKIKITLILMILWTILTWILVPILIVIYGFNGVALAAVVISFTGILPILMLRRVIEFNFLRPIYKPLVSTLVMIVPVYFLLNQYQNLTGVIFSLFVGVFIYALFIWFWMKEEISPYLPKFHTQKL